MRKTISYTRAVEASSLPLASAAYLGAIVNKNGVPYWCDGTAWVPMIVPSASGAFSLVLNTWTLVAGSIYSAVVPHNLGTRAVTVQLWDTATNALVQADDIIAIDLNNVQVNVSDNTASLLCVVVANGSKVVLGSVDNGLKTFTYYATSMDSPNSSDWAINSLAPLFADPNNPSFNTRQFSNTVEQGVGFNLSIPQGATSVTFRFKGRAQVAQASGQLVSHKLYFRQIPDNAAIGAWGSAFALPNFNVPANNFYQSFVQTYSLAALGLTSYSMFQCELTRATTVSGGTQLATPWLLAECTAEFA